MKTQHYLASLTVIAAILITACDQEAFVERSMSVDRATKIDARTAEALSILSIVDLSVTSPQFDGSLDTKDSSSRKSRYLNVVGNGKGESDLLGTVLVRTQMRYFPLTQQLTGTIDMRFDDTGATLRLMVDGSGPLVDLKEYDAAAIRLSTQVIEGTGELSDITLEARSYFFDARALVYLTKKEFTAHILTEGSAEF
jgi:hypothetical protein